MMWRCPIRTICYLNENDCKDYRIISGIRTGRTLQDSSLPLIKGRHYLSPAEMAALYEPDDLQRTDEIASECRA